MLRSAWHAWTCLLGPGRTFRWMKYNPWFLRACWETQTSRHLTRSPGGTPRILGRKTPGVPGEQRKNRPFVFYLRGLHHRAGFLWALEVDEDFDMQKGGNEGHFRAKPQRPKCATHLRKCRPSVVLTVGASWFISLTGRERVKLRLAGFYLLSIHIQSVLAWNLQSELPRKEHLKKPGWTREQSKSAGGSRGAAWTECLELGLGGGRQWAKRDVTRRSWWSVSYRNSDSPGPPGTGRWASEKCNTSCLADGRFGNASPADVSLRGNKNLQGVEDSSSPQGHQLRSPPPWRQTFSALWYDHGTQTPLCFEQQLLEPHLFGCSSLFRISGNVFEQSICINRTAMLFSF